LNNTQGGLLFIIGIQPLGWFGQRPEFSQAIGMALILCILGKYTWGISHLKIVILILQYGDISVIF